MSGYTENRILIRRDYDFVFDITNRIELWPQLFTEYKEAEVLERIGSEILFRLTTFPEETRPSRTWVSKRTIDKANGVAVAERVESPAPFEYMKIRWEYERLPAEGAVIMTWMQDFAVAAGVPWSNEQMESFLNRNTRAQMASVKARVEAWER